MNGKTKESGIVMSAPEAGSEVLLQTAANKANGSRANVNQDNNYDDENMDIGAIQRRRQLSHPSNDISIKKMKPPEQNELISNLAAIHNLTALIGNSVNN